MDISEKYKKYKHKYTKYKNKYLDTRDKKLFAFFLEHLNTDTHIIIVSAYDEKDALKELDKLSSTNNPYLHGSHYAENIPIEEIKSYIHENKIEPTIIKPPYWFVFYNG